MSDRVRKHCSHRHALAESLAMLIICACVGSQAQDADSFPAKFAELSSQYCVDCHAGPGAEARLDLEAFADEPVSNHFAQWQRVRRALAIHQMPPADGEPLPAVDRQEMLDSLQSAIDQTIQRYAQDPGSSVIRRLTSAEYNYCIEDLTGLQLKLGERFVSDSVGGSGFTNSASAQFMQDATLERYLEAARIVAEHAMLGSGPIYFYDDPGQTGLELSAVGRIQQLYRTYGFRVAAGEGAEPYGLDCYARAFQVAWLYRFREQLDNSGASLDELAVRMQVESKFAQHIWSVLNRPSPSFPLDKVIFAWNAFPAPAEIAGDEDDEIASCAAELYRQMQLWQSRLASSASDEEEASVLTGSGIDVPSKTSFVCRALRKRKVADDSFTPDTNNRQLYSEDGTVRYRFSIESASAERTFKPAVIFRNPQFRFRVSEVVQPDPVPLQSVLKPSSVDLPPFGQNSGGEAIAPNDFVLGVGESVVIEVELPTDCRVGELRVDAELDAVLGRDSVVRCVIEDITDERGRTFSSLLRDRNSTSMDQWEAGISEFAEALPQISHREPAPSDRDPIPLPFNNTYNLPERNYFHTAVKYHRDDDFLCDHVLDFEALSELNQAWTDLLTSFDYHNVNLRFTCKKYDIELDDRQIESISAEWIESLASEPRAHIARFKTEYEAMRVAIERAEQLHIDNALEFAARAWRRPLSKGEGNRLRQFYTRSRTEQGLTHTAAIRAVLTRVLISPDFLFRVEQRAATAGDQPLSPHELASRLSFSLWSSTPDRELLSLADDGSLLRDDVLRSQLQRMSRSPKARRLAIEFFGQWLGFYQFDRFRGVDVERFPEFDDKLRESLYEEAISLFEHIIREDRPYQDILSANYTFLDEHTAKHYGIQWQEIDGPQETHRMLNGAGDYQRGGVFGLGAILTVTSSPLRTSPVKRGDWILRRLVGMPVPPPPADAGSIPAEDILSDGQTVRQRLEVHRNNAQCMSCHVRIDPLGFALENFDSLGRYRDTYRDGQAIDATGILADGQALHGLSGLKDYMTKVDEDFRRTLSTRLVNYFLGRSETVVDAALIDRMVRGLEADPRLSTAVLSIVLSPQFRRIRSMAADTDQLANASKEIR